MPLTALARDLIENMTPEQLIEYLNDHPEDEEVVEAILSDPDVAKYALNRQYRDKPVDWVDKRLKEFLWSKQRELYASVLQHRYTAVKSCHASGKSFSISRLACWWVECHPPNEAFVVTTAPTGDQVKGVIWREMNRAHSKGNLIGKMGVTQWTIGGDLVAVGRKPANSNPAAFQGLHELYMLIIIDEADGVVEAIFDAAADTLGTNRLARIVAIGNPDHAAGPFFKACQPGSGWHVITISAFETPNFTDEPVPPGLYDMLVSKEWVEERRRKWGEDDPRWQSKVLGEFPQDNPLGVIPYSKLVECMNPADEENLPHRRYTLDDRGRKHQDPEGTHIEYEWERLPDDPEWGLDVGAGGDLTVLWERRGPVLCRRTQVRDVDPEKQCDHIERWAYEVGRPAKVKIDTNGVGWAIWGILRRRAQQVTSPLYRTEMVSVNVGKGGKPPSSSTEGFAHLRDEIWWDVGREPIIAGKYDLRVLRREEHEDAVQELTLPEWDKLLGGRIVVTPKKELRKELGRSPDDADAILLAFYDPKTQGRIAPAIEITETEIAGLRQRFVPDPQAGHFVPGLGMGHPGWRTR